MLQVDFEAQAVRRQLDWVLASAGFARIERLTGFCGSWWSGTWRAGTRNSRNP
jgi:hypothetical protein